MKHRAFILVALPLLFLAVALVAVRSFGGPGGSASADVGTGTPHLEIDVVQDPGKTWCNPVTTTRDSGMGNTYQAAICLSDAQSAPGAFNIEFLYDDTLNSSY